MHKVLQNEVSDAMYILKRNHGHLKKVVPEHKMTKGQSKWLFILFKMAEYGKLPHHVIFDQIKIIVSL